MRKFSAVLLLFTICSLGYSQDFPSKFFHKGAVFLNDGTTQLGEIKYDLGADAIVVQLPDEKGISTYNANQFKSFRILPFGSELPRVFYTLPFRGENGYRRPKIFEAILDGETSLIGREYIIVKSRPVNTGFNRRSLYDPFYDPFGNLYTTKYLSYELYIVDQEGGIKLLGNRRKDVIHAFEDHHGELRRYIKKEKLRMDRLEDVAQLVDYYNSLDTGTE